MCSSDLFPSHDMGYLILYKGLEVGLQRLQRLNGLKALSCGDFFVTFRVTGGVTDMKKPTEVGFRITYEPGQLRSTA